MARRGGIWTRLPSADLESAPAKDFLYGVAGRKGPAGSRFPIVWAVGVGATSPSDLNSAPLALRWNGSAFASVAVPDPSQESGTSFAAVALGSGALIGVFAGGTWRDPASVADYSGLVMRRVGERWTIRPTPVVVPGHTSNARSTLNAVLGAREQMLVEGWCTTASGAQCGFVASGLSSAGSTLT